MVYKVLIVKKRMRLQVNDDDEESSNDIAAIFVSHLHINECIQQLYC